MFDARYAAYATISALLVISPGATMAVVLETVVGEGRRAAIITVLGINIGNSTLAIASALGMSVVFHAWPSALHTVRGAGAIYLAYLGVRGMWRTLRGPWRVPAGTGLPSLADCTRDGAEHPGPGAIRTDGVTSWLSRGIATNLLNPPVVLFYMMLLPQFIAPADPFVARFLVLAATHIGMSLMWLTAYAFALAVLAERFARPVVRRTLEGVTGAILVALGARLVM